MAKIAKTELKKHLKECSADELINELCKLSGLFPQVNEYFFAKYGGEAAANKLLSQAKDAIENEFFPLRGMPRARISVAKKAISDFKKQCADPAKIAELQLFYVAEVSEFMENYGSDEPFCNTMFSVFENFAETATKIEDESVLRQFIPTIQKIDQVSYRIGYGMDGFVTNILSDYGLLIDEIGEE